MSNQKTERYQEWKRLIDAGYDYRTAYVLSTDNPLAAYLRLEKVKKDSHK
ncbi:hypothetical protein [Nostoc sp. 2RC]|nr:hypothetical protein [Nostoc sp. 2RC]MBC1236658.1 hypothetical protein [Nostoc sp. 2RC]